jgi:hypothetical protein
VSPSYGVLASAVILFMLGILHLKLTYVGRKLWPRDDTVRAVMLDSSPRITDELNMWQAWKSFNASHSLGAMLFGLVYGYLAVEPTRLLFSSYVLQMVGAATLLSYVVLARRYWFITPFVGTTLALLLFVGGLVAGYEL